MQSIKRICVFSGSRPGFRSSYVDDARELGIAIAERGYGLVYGGASVGLMGVVANAVLERGGNVTGVIPRTLVEKEVAHENLTELRIVESMHERKALMAKLSDAFIALPGGFGTFEELFETVTWSQLGIHEKPLGLLNSSGYYEPLLALVEHGISEGFIPADQRALIISRGDAKSLLLELAAFEYPKLGRKWIDMEQT